jgi:hypothetical protein
VYKACRSNRNQHKQLQINTTVLMLIISHTPVMIKRKDVDYTFRGIYTLRDYLNVQPFQQLLHPILR